MLEVNRIYLNGLFEESYMWVVWAMPVYELQYVQPPALPSYCTERDVLYTPSISVIFPLLVKRAVPTMVVWLSLRTFCSKGSEISLVHIVLCLCLTRCQIERKTECKQAMALVFFIRMSGQAWEILTAGSPRRLHLTSLLLRYTLTKRVCHGLEENLNVARVYILGMCLQHIWAWGCIIFLIDVYWIEKDSKMEHIILKWTQPCFKALYKRRGFEIQTASFHPLKIDSDQMVFDIIISSLTYKPDLILCKWECDLRTTRTKNNFVFELN